MHSLIHSALLTCTLLSCTIVFATEVPPPHLIALSSGQGRVNLAQFRGKVVYLDFWASWCTPCRKSFPWMNEIDKRFASEGLVVFAVSVDAEQEAGERFADEVGADFLVAYDPEGQLASAFDVQAMPSSYLIDRNGKVRRRHLGFRSKDVTLYEREIRELLDESL